MMLAQFRDERVKKQSSPTLYKRLQKRNPAG